jgi:hypothetical protein
MDRQSAPLRPAHLLHRFPARHMHDHDRHADDLGVADGPVRRLALDGLRPRDAVIIRRDMAFLLESISEMPDGVIALAMDHDERLLAASNIEHFQQLFVVENEIVVGHEDLERGIAVAHQRRQFLPKHDRGRIGNDQVKRGVDIAFAFREFAVILHAGPE